MDRTETPEPGSDGPPADGWTALIDDIRRGAWVEPASGATVRPAPFDIIEIADSLDGAEPDLLARLGMTGSRAVVADTATWDALGARVAANLGGTASVVLDHPHADLAAAADLAEKLRDYAHVIAVGSGTLNDLCKYVTAQDGRRYCVFATAASMDGYTSKTASITLDSGLKVSLPAHEAAGVFIDLSVSAAAPRRLAAAGFGDSICRSVCQIDWWMSHRLLGSYYTDVPYAMAARDEAEIMARAGAIGAGAPVATGYLQRNLVLSGLGVSFTGVSNHGSMGEHQISHYIDCFAGPRHPGSLHGEQVGVATLTMARLQHWFLDQPAPPQLHPTRIDEADMARRMGPAIAAQCAAEYRKKANDTRAAAAMNEKLAEIWPSLRAECQAFAVAPEVIEEKLSAAGGATTATALGIPAALYREAVRHGHEMRNRFSFADLACDAGILDDFAAGAA
ncbi:MAG: iron-containing alcohol dehydrogenase [Pseudomonadota bacterium]